MTHKKSVKHQLHCQNVRINLSYLRLSRPRSSFAKEHPGGSRCLETCNWGGWQQRLQWRRWWWWWWWWWRRRQWQWPWQWRCSDIRLVNLQMAPMVKIQDHLEMNWNRHVSKNGCCRRRCALALKHLNFSKWRRRMQKQPLVAVLLRKQKSKTMTQREKHVPKLERGHDQGKRYRMLKHIETHWKIFKV